jgi:class 3 adenylate cyclase/tetratricopeptide (TPR) repeat protein
MPDRAPAVRVSGALRPGRPLDRPFRSGIIRKHEGSRMDVATWLRDLGLGQYEVAFRENAVDEDILPRLTAEDLKDLGITSVGHRRRLLDAISRLRPETRAPTPATAAAPSPFSDAPPTRAFEVAAERRPITVMFCDLVGSTGLATRLDAEDWRNLVNAYLDEASKAVTELGGHVLKKLGDGLMALFGYPQAQENDAERAVRAALAIQRGLGELNASNAARGAPELAARIGLESGLVVVDSAGEVFGEAPNVAARVQAAAEPGAVLVTSTVQRQVAGLFIVEDKGAHEFKGVPTPTTLYRILRVSGGRRRKGARVLTPFVGREEDLAVLARRWERARVGEGQFVQIVGEPGLGKSRLVEEFRARIVETPHSWIEWTSSQLLQNTPLHPVVQWGRARFGGPEVPPERRLADLETVLSLIKLDPAEHAPLLAPLVDIPVSPERMPSLPPDEFRRKQLAAMLAWALAGARIQPLVLVFEDLQWFDPSSIELLHALSKSGAEVPILILATARPEFRTPWNLRPHHSVISLTPLDAAQVQRMVVNLASRHALSTDVIKGVSERAGGVPLFVEEVTRLLLERGEQGGVQAIPPTLRQSLAARLDRLGSAREVAQIGAVLGRSFSHALLRDVASPPLGDRGLTRSGDLGEAESRGLDAGDLHSALDDLIAADLLFVEGVPPEATYRFKHALIQDAAYDSLLKSHRQALHRRAAEALIEAGAEPEALAHHFTAAGADDLAIEWWGKAGEEALRRSAFKEAIAHLDKAIAMADGAEGGAPQGETRDAALFSRRLKLHTDYGHAAMWLKGFAADEMSDAYARASELAGSGEDAAARFVAYYGECLRGFMRGHHRQALAAAEAFLREAEAEGRATEAGVARRVLGFVLLKLGDLQAARSVLEQALGDYIRERDRETLFRFGNDTQVSATNFLALTEWHLGEFERARQLTERSTRRAAELGHVAAVASALFFKTVLESRRGDVSATRSSVESLLALTREHGMKTYLDVGQVYANWARGRQLDPEAGALGLKQALESYLALGNKSSAPVLHGLFAELEAMRQDPDSALARIDEGLAIADETGEHFTDPYLHRLRGEILLKRDPANPVRAEEAFHTAIAIAKGQGARGYELLASLSLARLYQPMGRRAEAHAILAPPLVGFSPTAEMPEIAEAQALLSAL